MAATCQANGYLQQYNYLKARWEWKTYLGKYLKTGKQWEEII